SGVATMFDGPAAVAEPAEGAIAVRGGDGGAASAIGAPAPEAAATGAAGAADAAAVFQVSDAAVSGPDWAAASALANRASSIAASDAPKARGSRALRVGTPALFMLHHAAFSLELSQMRAHRAGSRRMQILRNVSVDLLDDRHRLHRPRAVGKRLEHLALAQFAMSNVFADLFFRIADNRAVGRINRLEIEREQPPERIHVLAQVARIVRNDGSTCAQHNVPREQCALFFEIVAQVIGRVARSKYRAQSGAFGVNDGVVADRGNGAGGSVVTLPRHLQYFHLAESLGDLLDASQVVDVRMRQDNSFELAAGGEFLERGFEQVGVNRDALASVEQ